MAPQFDDKVALVTGAGSGIGRATALAFSREGARVAVADVDAAGGAETVRLIERESTGSRSALFHRVDVTQPSEVEQLIKEIVSSWGRLDFAHNNAGAEGTGVLTHLYPEAEWRRILEVNLFGAWLCMKHELTQMLEQGYGAIVNTASIAGLVASPASGSAYTASKHGIIGLTKSSALEYAKQGIRVNAVCPGVVHTPMVERHLQRRPELREKLVASEPIGRMAEPAEIAAAVIWLCSDAASFVTGHPMVVDGGMVAQ